MTHRNYKQLTDDERNFVNENIDNIYELSKKFTGESPPLAPDDRLERFADAFAIWIIESRS